MPKFRIYIKIIKALPGTVLGTVKHLGNIIDHRGINNHNAFPINQLKYVSLLNFHIHSTSGFNTYSRWAYSELTLVPSGTSAMFCWFGIYLNDALNIFEMLL